MPGRGEGEVEFNARPKVFGAPFLGALYFDKMPEGVTKRGVVKRSGAFLMVLYWIGFSSRCF